MRTSRKLFALALLGVLTSYADRVPRPSPDFTIPMTNGRPPIQISEHKGKVVVVIFLLTQCPHCQKTVGILSKMQTDLGPKGLQVVGCAIEDMAQMYVPDFVKKFQPPFPVGYSLRDPVLAYLEHPAMLRLMMPQVVVIDRQFVIRTQLSGDDPVFEGDQEGHLRAVIEPLLGKKK